MTYERLVLNLKDRETKVEFKKIIAEFGTSDKAIKELISRYKYKETPKFA